MPTSTPCPRGSERSAARSGISCTPQTRRSRRRSSEPSSRISSSTAISAHCWPRKDHVNVFLYDGAIVPDPEGIITAGHDNKTARTVAFRRDEKINEPALVAMFKQIIANNRAGGWRKVKGR
jgi:hypothetical protein